MMLLWVETAQYYNKILTSVSLLLGLDVDALETCNEGGQEKFATTLGSLSE